MILRSRLHCLVVVLLVTLAAPGVASSKPVVTTAPELTGSRLVGMPLTLKAPT